MELYTDNFAEIIELLNAGKIILYPTDTIWGLGCDAMNKEAIEKIYTIKERVPDKPFIILVSDIDMLKSYIKDIHPRVETLLSHHTRPLTVIYKAKKNIPEILLENGKVAIRVIVEEKIAELIRQFGRPIVSTSANISNEDFPENFESINSKIKAAVDYIFHYKRNDKELRAPSVIASFSKSGKLKFHR